VTGVHMTKSKWSKKDIKTLQQQLMSFVFVNELFYPPAQMREAIEGRRMSIILDGLGEHLARLADRKLRDLETAEHFRTHPTIYGMSTPEMVDRFMRLAKDCETEMRKTDRLLKRVEREGLPPEVAQHMPGRVVGDHS
jgi:hypothetical protein